MRGPICYSMLIVFGLGCTQSAKPVSQSPPRAPKALVATQPKNVPDVEVVAQTDRPLDPVATGLAARPIVVDAVRSLAVDTLGKRLAVGTGTGEIQLWSVPDWQLLNRWKAHRRWVFDLQFHPDRDALLSAGGDGRIRLWHLVTTNVLKELVGHSDDVHGAAFLPDGTAVLSGSDDFTVRLWNLNVDKDREILTHREIGKHLKQVTSVAVTHDGTLGATGSRDHTAKLWNLSTGELVATLEGHKKDVMSVQFNERGDKLLTSSYDGTVGVWDVKTRQREQTLSGHEGWVFTAIWGVSEQQILSGADHSMWSWRFENSQFVSSQSIMMPADVADLALIMGNERKLLAAGLSNGVVQLFDVTDSELKPAGKLFAPPLEVDGPDDPPDLSQSKRWVDWHLAANFPQETGWDSAIEKLGEVGTPWTLKYLQGLNRSSMSLAQVQLLDRVILQLQKDSEELSPKNVRQWLEREAWCDLTCNALESELVPWTNEQIRAAANVPKMRTALKDLVNTYQPVQEEPKDKFMESCEKRIRLYAARALQMSDK